MNTTRTRKSAYILLLLVLSPLLPIINGVNYPVIYIACISLFAAFLMTREDGTEPMVPTAVTVRIALYLAALTLLTAWLSQPPVTLNGGLGWDGLHYASLYERFLHETSPLPLHAPFHQRLGLPYLASLLPMHPRPAFYVLHSLFWLGTVWVFVLICRDGFQLPHALTIIGVIWLQIHWISVPRGAASYSYIVDSSAMFFMTALSYMFVTRRYGLPFILLAAVGAVFKETILLWCLCLAFGTLTMAPGQKRKNLLLTIGIAFVASAGINLVCKSIFEPQGGLGPAATIVAWMQVRAFDPGAYSRYLSAAFNGLGGFLVIMFFFGARSFTTTLGNRIYRPALAAAGLYLAVCFFSGSDLTKFAFMSFPLVLPVILSFAAQHIDREKHWWTLIIIILTLPVAHIVNPILSPFKGREIPNLDANGAYSWMMEYAHPFLVAFWLFWLVFVYLVARGLFRYARKAQ